MSNCSGPNMTVDEETIHFCHRHPSSFSVIWRHPLLRSRKEYVILSVLCFVNMLYSFAFASAGLFRIRIIFSGTANRLVTRWQCLLNQWNLAFFISEHVYGATLTMFSNLLGTVYKDGNLVFAPDGNTILSPVGNKVSLFDLKNHKSETLPIETQLNIKVLAINPSGTNLILVDEKGLAFYVSLISKTILHRIRLNKPIKDIKFSPDGKKFAVCRDTDVQLYRSPGTFTHQYTPLFLETVYHASHDSTNCLDWSFDSKLFAVGSSDMQTKVCAGHIFRNVYMVSLGGHMSPIMGCFFEKDSFDLYTVEKRGYLVQWEANLTSDDLKSGKFDKDDVKNGTITPLQYSKAAKQSFHEALGGATATVTCAAYNNRNRLLVTGFSNGSFVLHEMPDFNMIHNLSVSDQSARSVSINSTGDWLAIGCGNSTIGQLLVWEWQSESYIMKQQSHAHNLTCLSYSPDGAHIATGAQDGKVKVWCVKSGFCIVTFSEHTGGISGVVWTQAGKALLSAALDGSVRAFDLKRYRNFRTLVCPRPAQLSCICVDSSGEIVCAGAKDVFDIFVWSLQNGRLLEVLSGHDAPVSSVNFNPAHAVLASVSWDKTLRIWDVFEGKGGTEILHLSNEGLSVQFSPDGEKVGAVTLDCQITWYDWRQNIQLGQIEGKIDLDPGRGEEDQITAKKSAVSKSFTTMSYSADGDFILSGGQSKYICIYHVKQQLLVKKFQITCNLSLDSVADDLDRRKMTELGNLNLIDASDSEEESEKKLKLPGAKSGDQSRRTHRPEVRVTQVQFSPTGRSWAACSTEGLLIYSLDDVVIFDPFQLEVGITPDTIEKEMEKKEFGRALTIALKLNENELIQRAIEATPVGEVQVISQSLPLIYVEKLLEWFGKGLENTRHLEFYLIWIKSLFYHHGTELKLRNNENIPIFTSLQQVISTKHEQLGRICDFNKYTSQYILNCQRLSPDEKIDIE